MKLLQELQARNIGPGGVNGRVTFVGVVNDYLEVMYLGTASGGFWKWASGGIKRGPILDKEDQVSIRALARQGNQLSVRWAYTVEGSGGYRHNDAYGIYNT